MIAVDKLFVNLGGRMVLQDISFRLETGENLIILGRSGSGKTVLIKTLMGFNTPDSGSVIVDDQNVYAANNPTQADLRHEFAMVFENSALLDSFTVFQNIALPLFERGEASFEKVLALVKNSLAEVGLEDVMDKYPSELSGGMRKRVGIARALVYDPRYIIFDEPISGLDPITAREVLYYINQIIHSARATTITITHDVHNLSGIGNKVLFLESGKALFYGGVETLYASKDALLQNFVGTAK